jgi:hypothetical protein
MYGKAHTDNVDDVRYASFQHHYAPKANNDPLEKVQGTDPSTMPPCKSVLMKKIIHTNYVSLLWKHASLPNPCIVRPDGFGWIVVDGNYQII